MKKFILSLMAICCVVVGYSQKRTSDFELNPKMYEQFTQAEINQMMQTDFAQLFKLNYKMTNYALMTTKLPDSNYQMLGGVQKYANPGVVTNESEIASTGFINPFLYSLPQDAYRVNVFTLSNGCYIMVLPKNTYEEREQAQLSQYVY
ncbi:MAG: hypothetical protein MJZ57_01730 [Bacteroidales bacterium]|nr:hypothetical protein [Bacteroidales bacterium]